MHTRVEERRTLRAAIVGILFFIAVQIIQSTIIYRGIETSWFKSVYVLAGWGSVAASFAVFAQGWLLFSHKLSRYRLYTAALFLCLAALDFLQTMSMIGIPLFGYSLNQDDSMWLLIISKGVCTFGILIVYSLKDTMVSIAHKSIVFTTTIVFLVMGMGAFGLWHYLLPALLDHGSMNSLKKSLDLGIITICLLGIGSIVYRGR